MPRMYWTKCPDCNVQMGIRAGHPIPPLCRTCADRPRQSDAEQRDAAARAVLALTAVLDPAVPSWLDAEAS